MKRTRAATDPRRFRRTSPRDSRTTDIRDAVGALGIEVRAGLHTGEVELMGRDLGRIAVHTGARVCGLAGPSEVLVSRTVQDLVAGSGITFKAAGEHELRGIPDSLGTAPRRRAFKAGG